MNLRHWIKRLEAATRDTNTMILVDERNGKEYQVPNTAFIEVLGAAATGEVDESIAELVDEIEADRDLLYHLVIRDTGDPFWWTRDQCFARRHEDAQ